MSSQHATKQNQKRTGTHDIDPRLMGMVIGRGGETVKRIARDAGCGCRINRTDKPGRFELTAWDSNAIQRAKIAIDTLIREAKTKTKTKTKTQTKTKTPVRQTSVAAAFGSDSDSDDESEATVELTPEQQRHQAKLRANASKARAKQSSSLSDLVRFKSGEDGIAARKKANWQNGQAYRAQIGKVQQAWDGLHPADRAKHGSWETYKYQEMGKYNRECDKNKRTAGITALESKPKPVAPATLDASDFPLEMPTSYTAQLGAWGNTKALDGVRQEEAVVKPEVKTEKSMPVLQRSVTSTPKLAPKDAAKDECLLAMLPKGPGKRFKSKTIALARPQLQRAETMAQSLGDGAWSDDDDREIPDSWDTAAFA